MTLYFRALNTINSKELLEILIKAQEKTELLLLYFGHEDESNDTTDLFDLSSNKNKNRLVVEFLLSLSEKFYIYYEYVKDGKLKSLEVLRDNRLEEMQNHLISIKNVEIKDEFGNLHIEQEAIFDDEYNNRLNNIQGKIDRISEHTKSINKDLKKLRNIIRIYLKIEWNKAKKGI